MLWGKGEEEANGNGERQGLGEMTVFTNRLRTARVDKHHKRLWLSKNGSSPNVSLVG